MKPNYIQHGPVSIEYVPPIARYVTRINEDGSIFNGKDYDATITAEIVSEDTLYVCIGITLFEGGCSTIIKESIDWFIAQGFVYATFRRNNIDKRQPLSKIRKLSSHRLSEIMKL
jgi:hypothetical protein